ncbi:MAG: 30S ribosome-binding factor RbfA [Pseudomonadales bacterium]|nr:30S ribosome-binding factor RbfA [Pseudomonadales bacterium]
MARDFSRQTRVADYLRRDLSLLIQREIRDPRLTMVSVTDVEVSRDLSHAKVYVTIMGCEDKAASVEPLNALNGAAGFLRSMIAKSTTWRTTPALRFVYDESVSRGSYLSSLIDTAVKEDSLHPKDESESDSDENSEDADS